MSHVIAAPEMITSAATDLATIGSDLGAAHTAAAAPTVTLVPAAADEVSASIAHLFSQYGGGFQALACPGDLRPEVACDGVGYRLTAHNIQGREGRPHQRDGGRP